jgi:hypothetical protein
MAKGRKKTKGLKGMASLGMPKPMTPDQMMDYSAKSVLRDAMEASPKFKAGIRQVKTLAKKIVRGAGGGATSEA